MLGEILRAGAIVAVGHAADRLGYAMLPAADLARERAYDCERVRDLDDLSGELVAALRVNDVLAAERDELVHLLRRVAQAKPGSDGDNWVPPRCSPSGR